MTTIPTISGRPLAVGVPAAAVEHRATSSGGRAAGVLAPTTPAATSFPAHAGSP